MNEKSSVLSTLLSLFYFYKRILNLREKLIDFTVYL